MEMGLWCCVFLLLLYSGFLTIKIYLFKKSAREIRKAFCTLIETDTNAIIEISSRDPDLCRLALAINTQLELFYKKRRYYEQGNLELKEAITNISHDLRTPLTAIYGYLDLLRKEECFENVKNGLAVIENRTRVLKQLTEELFQYTIVLSDDENMVLEQISLNGILENTISAYYSVLKQKNMTPKISIPEKKIMRKVNENALSRVLGNIISNAVKYSDGDLEIVLTEEGEILFSNHVAELTEVQIERMFDRFYTVNTARKSTGLGLAIARTLIEKMGGTVTADYTENILTICVRLP
ncbi:MAG: HAMP domain-containing sensor histidine kinase [Eubacteriales bacterium]|nr:HAMP domain-containing sensor histidine kinase [Eubacteriales bacterium]